MNKQVEFTEDDLDYYAEFLVDGRRFEFKVITQVEKDGLEEFVEFDKLPKMYDAEELYEDLSNCYFDTDGEPTHYEEILYDLINVKESNND